MRKSYNFKFSDIFTDNNVKQDNEQRRKVIVVPDISRTAESSLFRESSKKSIVTKKLFESPMKTPTKIRPDTNEKKKKVGSKKKKPRKTRATVVKNPFIGLKAWGGF